MNDYADWTKNLIADIRANGRPINVAEPLIEQQDVRRALADDLIREVELT